MGGEVLWKDWDGSGYPLKGPGRGGRHSRMFGMGRGPSERSGMGWGTLKGVRDGLRDPYGGPGWVGGTTRRFRTGRGTLREVWDGSRDPSEVRDASGGPP